MKPQTLSKRLIKLQLTLTCIMLLISWIFLTLNDLFIFKNLSLQKFESTAKILSRNLNTCLAFKDQEECLRVLNSLKLEESIQQATVIDQSGKNFASYVRKGEKFGEVSFDAKGDGYEYLIKDQLIISTYPITENAQTEGRLFLRADFDMMETFGKRHALAFLIIVIGSIFISIYISRHLQRNISEQIRLILEGMKRLKIDKNYSLRITQDHTWKNVQVAEFLELGESFDAMIEQVQIRDISMKTQNENLEKIIEDKVQEVLRTAELASLGEMAGGIAHEINNPLTIIASTNKVLMKLLNRDSFDKDKFIELVQSCDQTVVRIAKIVSGLRNISRKSEDTDVVDDCAFQEVFNDVLEIAESRFKSKDIEIRKSYSDAEANFKFRANRIQLSQVLINLLNNSFDAIVDSPDDKWIEVKISIDEKMVNLRITDSGPGIPVKVRDKMFNPFFTTKEIGKGTGIGLPISKSMVEKMGGHFSYDDNSPNTSFVIQLGYVKA